MSDESIWNIDSINDHYDASAREARSPAEVVQIVRRHFQDRKISVLEIGVYRCGLTKRLHDSGLNISQYDGVDPYLGTTSDPYFGAYWNSPSAAQSVHDAAAQVFRKFGYTLHRTTSVDFKRSLRPDQRFDLIYVDGDHRYAFALWDMCAFLPCLSDDGLLMVDDYANVDAPDVTRAFNDFMRKCRRNVSRVGYARGEFVNTGKFAPVAQYTVYVQSVETSRRHQIDCGDVPGRDGNNDPIFWAGVLDISPRKLIRAARRAVRVLRDSS